MKSAAHVMLVDCSGFMYRAWHSSAANFHPEHGQPTGAVEAFLKIMWDLLGDAQADMPTHGIAVFDAPGVTFRQQLYPNYKWDRPRARAEELDAQFSIMKAGAPLLGLTAVQIDGVEADDTIATLAAKAVKAGMRVTIVSGDKDLQQCVVEGQCEVIDPMFRRRVGVKEVRERFGVAPYLVPHVQALAGDTVDKIPGISGCGMETAQKLIRTFGTVHAMLRKIDHIRFPAVRAWLKKAHTIRDIGPMSGVEWVKIFLQLTTLRANVPLKIKWADYTMRPIMKDDLMVFLKRLGAAGRAESIFGLDPQMLRPVPPVENELEWWTEELAAGGQPVPDLPQVGFYFRRYFKRGPMVPARVFRSEEVNLKTDAPTGRELLRCEIGGKAQDPLKEWPRLALNPISEEEYADLMKAHQPGAKPSAPPPDIATAKISSNPRKPARKLKNA